MPTFAANTINLKQDLYKMSFCLHADSMTSEAYLGWHQQGTGCFQLVVQDRLDQVLARSLCNMLCNVSQSLKHYGCQAHQLACLHPANTAKLHHLYGNLCQGQPFVQCVASPGKSIPHAQSYLQGHTCILLLDLHTEQSCTIC